MDEFNPRDLSKVTAADADRLWAKTVILPSGCWQWTGDSKARKGYGLVTVNRLNTLAHRFAYRLYYNHDPGKMCVLHKCDNPGCVNPLHLTLGTYADNNHDRDSKGRFTPLHGELGGGAKLKNENVLDIRERVAGGEPRKMLAVEYGVDISNITLIVQRKTWKHI